MIKHVLKDSAVYGLSSVILRGMGIILVPLYTRVMPPQDFGAFELILTFGAIANLLVALEVSQGQARFWNDASDKVRLASTAVWFTTLMYILFTLFSLYFASEISYYLIGTQEYQDEYKIGVLFIALNGIYQIIIEQFRWDLKSKTYAAIALLQVLLLCVGVFICYEIGYGLEGILLSQIVAVLAALITSTILVRKQISFIIDYEILEKMIRFSLPLVPAAMGTLIYTHIGRLVLNHYHGLDQVGQLGLAMRISGIAIILFSGIRLGITPLIYKHYKESKTPDHLARLFNAVFATALLFCLSVSLFSHELIGILAPRDYSVSSILLGALSLSAVLFQVYVFFPGIALRKKTTLQIYITMITAMVCLVSNMLLTPKMGAIGVGISSLLSSLTFITLWIAFSQKLYFVPFNPYRVLIVLTILITTIGLTQFMSSEMDFVFKVLVVLLFSWTVVIMKLFRASDLKAGIKIFQN